MDEQELSWLVVEPGWAVVAADGSEVGYVEQIVGDSDEDIFNGLSISTSIFDEPRYVPSEKVARIFEDRVELAISSNDVEALAEFLEPPPSLDIDAEKASWSDRLLEEVTDVDTKPRRSPVVEANPSLARELLEALGETAEGKVPAEPDQVLLRLRGIA